MWPVILRELRAQSRQSWTYWARVIAGVLVTLDFAHLLWSARWAAINGLQLIDQVGFIAIGLIWCVSPVLMADCLSGEKRQGTLGLLLLTRLSAVEIVLAKLFVHGLRTSGLVIAATPVIAFTLLLGGVSGQTILVLLLHVLVALALTLGAGLLASAWARDWLRAVILAVVFNLAVAAAYYNAVWDWIASRSLGLAIVQVLAAILFLIGAVAAAARHARLTCQEEARSALSMCLEQIVLTPVFWTEFLRQRLATSLDRNPIGWLYERTAPARLCKWVWCLAATLLVCRSQGAVSHSQGLVLFQIALMLAMAFSGAASFQRERQNGVMELLLVSPLDREQLVQGRLRALRAQYAPALWLMGLLHIWFLLWVETARADFECGTVVGSYLLLFTSLASLPALGLYLSFQFERTLTIWGVTCALGLGIPYFVGCSLSGQASSLGMFCWMAGLQAALGALAMKALRQGLDGTLFTRLALMAS